VLTNNPSFPVQLFNLNNFQGLSSTAKNYFSDELIFQEYSHGLGALGLPGDLSSASRFVRTLFHKFNSQDEDSIGKTLRLLSSVAMPNGSVKTNVGYERTEYTSVVDLDKIIYCYRTYDSLCPYALILSKDIVDGDKLITKELQIKKEPLY
jgi:choloylglycine hydrolase